MIQHFLATTDQYQFFQLFQNFLRKSCLTEWLSFLNLHNILYSKQLGLRNNHATALALIDLMSDISSAIDRNESTSKSYLRRLIPLMIKSCATICNTMVFGTLLCRGSKAILRIGLNLSSLEPIDLTIGKFHVASHRAQSLDLFLMSLAWLNLYCLLMRQIYFVPIRIPTTLFLFLTMNLQNYYLANKLSLYSTKTNFMIFHPRQKKINVNVPLVTEIL